MNEAGVREHDRPRVSPPEPFQRTRENEMNSDPSIQIPQPVRENSELDERTVMGDALPEINWRIYSLRKQSIPADLNPEQYQSACGEILDDMESEADRPATFEEVWINPDYLGRLRRSGLDTASLGLMMSVCFEFWRTGKAVEATRESVDALVPSSISDAEWQLFADAAIPLLEFRDGGLCPPDELWAATNPDECLAHGCDR